MGVEVAPIPSPSPNLGGGWGQNFYQLALSPPSQNWEGLGGGPIRILSARLLLAYPLTSRHPGEAIVNEWETNNRMTGQHSIGFHPTKAL